MYNLTVRDCQEDQDAIKLVRWRRKRRHRKARVAIGYRLSYRGCRANNAEPNNDQPYPTRPPSLAV
jgi:hypothetical protein